MEDMEFFDRGSRRTWAAASDRSDSDGSDDGWPVDDSSGLDGGRDWQAELRRNMNHLTAPQRAAVQHVSGPMLVLAGPGSGKTRVMSHRIAYLIAQGIPPWQIVALTFTNKAADELKNRIGRLVPGADVWAGTFHKFCGRVLRRYASLVGLQENYTILDRDDQRRLLKEAIRISGVELFHYTDEQIAGAIGKVKNRSIDPLRYLQQQGDPLSSLAARVFSVYQRRLLECNSVDFDDMLLHVAKLLVEQPDLRRMLDERMRYLLVDEYQDTNSVQYAIVRALSVDHPNLVVTGDPDQSIYGWRGADIGNILDFERDFPSAKVIRLEQNFRSTKRILEVADQLIANNQRRKHKSLLTDNSEGEKVRLIHYPDHRDEAEQIAQQIAEKIESGERRPSDFAIFYRVNSLSRSFEMALRKRSIPYQIVQGFEFYERREVKDVLDYLRLLSNPANDVAFERVVNTPTRGIGKTTIERLKAYAAQQKMPLLEAAFAACSIPGLSARSGKLVVKFAELIQSLSQRVEGSVEAIMGLVLAETGLREFLETSDVTEGEDRLANIDELLNAAREFDEAYVESEGSSPLEQYLEWSTLASDVDAYESDKDRVTLMTLHAAKGLEFPCVFIVALEHNILPHSRSKDDPDQLEEERRLLFVGITRAMQELSLSRAHYRTVKGSVSPTSASQFLMELPRETMACFDPGVDAQFRLNGKWGRRGSEEFHGETGDDVSHDFQAWDAFDGIDEAPEEWDRSQSDSEVSNDDVDAIAFDPDGFSDDDSSSGPKSTKAKKNDSSKKIRSKEAPGMMFAKLQTAAQMAGDDSKSNRVDPESFRHKQLVIHPEYGTGTIISLSGSGAKRVAIVKFVSHGEVTFRLAFSPLTPIG